MKTILIVTWIIAAAAARARADGFDAMAGELAARAKKAGVASVAVMPFAPAAGGGERDGWNIAEKLTTRLVRTGKVQTLERSLLKALMEEQELGRTGALDQATVRRLGRVLSAQGVITGSFTNSGREVIVNARLVDVETGVIVAASEGRAERDWLDLPGVFVPAPAFTVDVPTIEPEGGPELRDALSDDSCADAAGRVDRLESGILDLKARYWALRLKGGLNLASLTTNPGSTISDPELKKEFYDRMKSWYARKRVPALTASEIERFVAVDGRAATLSRKCGI